jgi:XTP/dITP diphosphohydrolase
MKFYRMNTIVFATNNAHKLEEVRSMLDGLLHVVSLQEIGCVAEIPETANTLEGNALLKANYVHKRFGLDCFADDTGLEIEALNGEPGVYSARYAGEENSAQKNITKVLMKMNGQTNRKARFRTVIALIESGVANYFEGKVDGVITLKAQGEKGFGYDPIFVPEGCNGSFAELSPELKNSISHRALAVKCLVDYLQKRKV